MMDKPSQIGVFDSGVGGLSILTKLIQDFPKESFVYLGDTARLPYGTKSKDTIKEYVRRNIKHLTENFDIKAIVVACNSASSVLDEIELPIKTIGVIEAGADAALSVSKSLKIGLWATRATVKSAAYEKELHAMEPEVELTSVSCPTLVTLIEELGSGHPLLKQAFDFYLEDIRKNTDIDCLILGCTHFPFFKNNLKDHLADLGSQIKLVDASDEISSSLKDLLHEDRNFKKTSLKNQILVTDDADHFKEFISRVLPNDFEFEFSKVDF